MKNKYNILFYIVITLFSFSEVSAQYTENFETAGENATTFTNNGYTFTTSGNPVFDVQFFGSAGAGGSDYFLDNFDNPGVGQTNTITLTGGSASLFTLKSMEVYVSSVATGDFPTDDGTVTFTGKSGASTVFTYTKTSGFPTSNAGTANGFFFLNLATDPSSDYTSLNIDRIEITLGGAFQYVSIDNFVFGDQSLEADPPIVQSIALVGTPNSTATSVDFTVNFNEDAINVSTDDFTVDGVGTTGTISNISGSGTSYTVTVSSISGEGTISIDLLSGTNITDTLGNGPPFPFTAGQTHTVSRCFQETFESFTAGDITFSSNGVTYTTGSANFDIENFPGGGAGGSAKFLSNLSDQGTGKIYNITPTGTDLFNIEALDMYLSSEVDGANPTNDGSVTFRGKLGGATLYTITKSTGFPTDFSVNNGFYIVDFATEGAADYSLTNIDELEIQIGGSFRYVGVDNFEHCEEITTAAPPIVQSIKLIGNPAANATNISYEVIFNENAFNVSSDDFSVHLTGSAAGAVSGITGSGNTYTVTVNSIFGEGSIRLDLNPGTNIQDADGNTPPDPFTSGELHIVTACDLETFEALANNTFTWTTGIVPLTTSTTNFSVTEFIDAGAGGSDRYLDNLSDQGTGKTYSISVTDASTILMGNMEVFVSSIVDGPVPTNDGTLTVRGKLNGSVVFSVTKSTGFPTSTVSNQGFYNWNFATEGGANNSITDVDEIEVELGGSFQYIAIDNFKFCEDNTPPTAICQSTTLFLDSDGNATITPSVVNNGSTDDSGTVFLGFETTVFSGETTLSSPTDELIFGAPFPYEASVFTVPTSGDYTFNATGTMSGGGLFLLIWDDTPIPNSGEYNTRTEFVSFSTFNNNGNNPLENVVSLVADKTYYMSVCDYDTGIGTYEITVDMPIRTTAANTTYTCTEVGDYPVTLYAFDKNGNSDSCSSVISVAPFTTEYSSLGWSGGIPNLGTHAVFSSDYNSAVVGLNIDTCTCEIENTSAVTITDGMYLKATDDITVNIGTSLRVTNEGSIVQSNDNASVTNNGEISVVKTTPVLAEKTFMIMGSPMTSETREGVYANAYIVRNHNTNNFIPNPAVAAAFPSAENFADDNGDNWLTQTGALNPAEGYMVFPQPNTTGSGSFIHDYIQGTLNNGVITKPLLYNTDQNSSPNIISNPYASAINADAFYADPANTAIDVLYFWEHITPLSLTYPGYNAANFSMGDISMYSESMGGIPAANGGATPTNIISSGQGFGVKAASAGIIATFNNAMRVTGPNDTYRRPMASERDRLWINVYNDAYGLGSTTLIGFSENTTATFEAHADIKRLATPVSLYSELATGEELAINALGAFEMEASVGLSFSTQVKELQDYRISLQNVEGINIENATVYVVDRQLGIVTNLNEGDYTFQSGEATYSERFKIVFQNQILGTNDVALDSVSVYPNPTQNSLYIVSPNAAITQTTVYDLQGRIVLSTKIEGTANAQINLSTLNSALYFVEITTEAGTITKRVLKD